HQSGTLDDVVVDAGVRLLAGLATGDDWGQLHPGEVDAVVAEAAAVHPRVVVNVGSGLERPRVGEGRFGLARALLRLADRIVGVGLPYPVGVARLIRWASEAATLAPDTPLVLAVNRIDRSPYRRAEIERELAAALPGSPVVLLPEDQRVPEAAGVGAGLTLRRMWDAGSWRPSTGGSWTRRSTGPRCEPWWWRQSRTTRGASSSVRAALSPTRRRWSTECSGPWRTSGRSPLYS